MTVNILVFGSENFNKSLFELKSKLHFNLIIYDPKGHVKQPNKYYDMLLIDSEFLLNEEKSILIKFEDFNIPILCLINTKIEKQIKYSFENKIYFPFNFFDLKKRINDLLATFVFHKNSSVNIKNYIVDKNYKIMKKENLFIYLTDKEINLLELLHKEKKPLNKKNILKKVWQYSDNADTHTVETHIYRLRKKVLDKFGDREFINIFKEGYSL